MKNLKINVCGIDNNSALYINPSLCPYSKKLAFNCRSLRRAGLISKAHTENDGSIKIQLLDGSSVKINHETDLTSRFCSYGFSF